MLNKRNIIIGAVAIGLIVALVTYLFFFRGSPQTPVDEQGSPFPQGTGASSSGADVDFRPPPTETPAQGAAATTEPRLFQIHDNPVVSAVSFVRRGTPYTRFIEQGSGHVYEYNFSNKQKVRISNTSIPQIGSAVWAADGSVVAFRYEQDGRIKSAVGVLASSTSEGAFGVIYFLPEGLRDVAVSPDGRSVFYMTENSSGGVGILANRDGSNPRTLFTSPLRHWRVSWPAAGFVIVQSPVTLSGGGVAYRVSVPSGARSVLTQSQGLFGGVVGDSSGQLLATNPATGRVSLLDSRYETFSDLDETSWPTKCSFIQDTRSSVVCANIPRGALGFFEEWGRGEFNSNDILVVTNFSEKYKELLIPEEEIGDRVFDMVNLSSTPGGDWVIFKNRPDGLLWGVRVPGGIE